MITDDQYREADQILERLCHEAACHRLTGTEELTIFTSLQGLVLILEAQQDLQGNV